MLVPGLLQIAEYSRAVAEGNAFDQTGTGAGEGGDIEIKIGMRLARQQRLHADPPLRLHAIVDENVIRRSIGGAQVMAAQLRHMEKMSRLPNVVLQVIPISRGAYPGLGSEGLSILDFAPGRHTQDYVCCLEGVIGVVWAEREADRVRISRVFQYIERLALTPAETRDVLESTIRELTGS
jgi:hypothetical protein